MKLEKAFVVKEGLEPSQIGEDSFTISPNLTGSLKAIYGKTVEKVFYDTVGRTIRLVFADGSCLVFGGAALSIGFWPSSEI